MCECSRPTLRDTSQLRPRRVCRGNKRATFAPDRTHRQILPVGTLNECQVRRDTNSIGKCILLRVVADGISKATAGRFILPGSFAGVGD